MAHSFITCSHCGRREDLEIYRVIHSPLVSKMRGEQLCFACAYWKNWIDNPEPDTIIVSGKLFKVISPLVRVNMSQARAKDWKFIINVRTHEIFGNRDLFLRGAIPDNFRNSLPDQYKFITKDEYSRILHFDGEMCLSKGCFDRYHCFWYRADIAEPDEPWNTIPKNYKPGSELCPSFINKYGILSGND